jgi:hypothetical protein
MTTVVRFWIIMSTGLVSAGWMLSALHELNRAGYLAVFALAAFAFVFWRRKAAWQPETTPAQLYQRLRHRFTRPAPIIFLALAVMALAGGVIYTHINPDSTAYRIPRIWHWLGDGQWHWIRTADPRMNIVACNYEWLSAPLMLFTRTDRWIFLFNWLSYLMLPGLIFSVFTRLQVRPRVAWWWMWLLATGWCYVMQAGSDATDAFAAVYALAAVDLALRALENNSAVDGWLSLLAAALLTGAKQNNIPLVLPWLVALWPARRLLWSRPLGTLMVAGTGLLISAVPVTVGNIIHAGNWQGLAQGTAHSGWSAGSPLWKFIGNLVSIPVQNLLPPFFPWSGTWNDGMARFLASQAGEAFRPFERFGHLDAGISESSAGLGLGLCLLTLLTLVAMRLQKPWPVENPERLRGLFPPTWLRLAPWLSLLVFMFGICSFADARLLSAYYVLFFPLLLAGAGHERIVRRRWWQRLAWLVMLLAVAVLMTARSRPLFPAVTITEKLKDGHPHSRFLEHLWLSYAWMDSYGERRNHFQKDFPAEEKVAGYATVNGCGEMGLWLPFGSRRVVRVLAEDTPEQLQAQGIHFVLVEDVALDAAHLNLEQWMQRYDARLVDQLEFYEDPYRPRGHYFLVRLNPLPNQN